MHMTHPIRRHAMLILVAAFTLLFGAADVQAKSANVRKAAAPVLYQVATLDALIAGYFDGLVSMRDFKRHGDFGIGTFDKLNGELVMENGKVWRVTIDGKASPVPDSETTPFASATRFRPGMRFDLKNIEGMKATLAEIDSRLPSPNIFYAVRITGKFAKIQTRSVPLQHKPYPTLTEVVKSQPIFTFADIDGVLIGFRCPALAKGLNVPGYHLHFLTDNRKSGGHLQDVSLAAVRVEIMPIREFRMILPDTADFDKLDLTKDTTEATAKVEK